MARYIDAEELINNLNEFAPELFNALINSLILKQPTADVREILHAHYDKNGDCSNCGCAMPTDDKRDFIMEKEVRYCYYCGAKMDKEE